MSDDRETYSYKWLKGELRTSSKIIGQQQDAIERLQARVEELEGLLNDPVRLRERIQMMLDIEALEATEQETE